MLSAVDVGAVAVDPIACRCLGCGRRPWCFRSGRSAGRRPQCCSCWAGTVGQSGAAIGGAWRQRTPAGRAIAGRSVHGDTAVVRWQIAMVRNVRMERSRREREAVLVERAASQIGRQREAIGQVRHGIDAAADAIAHRAGLAAERRPAIVRRHRARRPARTAARSAGARAPRQRRRHSHTRNRRVGASRKWPRRDRTRPTVRGIRVVDIDRAGELVAPGSRASPPGRRAVRGPPGKTDRRPTRRPWRRASARRGRRSRSNRGGGTVADRRRESAGELRHRDEDAGNARSLSGCIMRGACFGRSSCHRHSPNKKGPLNRNVSGEGPFGYLSHSLLRLALIPSQTN